MTTPVSPNPPAARRHRTLKQKWALISLPNKLMVIATVVIAAATLVNVVVARAMWREMQKSTVQVGRQIDDFEAAQRAVLVLEVYAVTDPIEVGKPVQLQCTIVNLGTTAATDIAISEAGAGGVAAPWITDSHSLRPKFDIPIPANGIPRPADVGGGESLGPNQPRDCSKTIGPLDADTVEGKYWINSTISISYRDMFGKAYILNDCLILPPKGQRFRHCHMVTDPKANQKPN